ncbi:PMEI domain-containing protein [Heracleum sosnowskyi]|uniref:PMEI domain-containing protein n=1 Tax=Heracleum sosnowskyi TaxID=360622 RepID=A0AAD8IQS5_9APIA|nr:PMEI domain-containing protein [Heracleum sosnowskyi]
MEFKSIFIFFTLLFFNSANAACVPRNNSTSSPNPHASRNLKPVSPSAAPLPPTAQSCPAPALGVTDAVLKGLPQATGNENPEIKKICDATVYPDVCLTTLGRYNGPSDMPTVLGIAIQAGTDLSKAAVDTADRLATQPGTPPGQTASLKDCKESYDDVLYSFQNAHDSLPAKDIRTMNTMLSAVVSNVGDCMDAFEGKDSPVSTFSDKLQKMASNCISMVSHLNVTSNLLI